jgi:transposase
VLAKNDPLDARMIASFVAIMPTRPAQPQEPAAERLAELLGVRRQLSAEKVAAENASRLSHRSKANDDGMKRDVSHQTSPSLKREE